MVGSDQKSDAHPDDIPGCMSYHPTKKVGSDFFGRTVGHTSGSSRTWLMLLINKNEAQCSITSYHFIIVMSFVAKRSTSPPNVDAVSIELESVQWTDFVEDEHGKAIGVCGIEWKEFSSKQLRTICSRLSVKGVKNFKKTDMVERLVSFYENKQAYNMLQKRDRTTNKPPRQQAQCSF